LHILPNYDDSLHSSHENILSSQGLNSLTFSDPYAKLCYTAMIVRSLAHPQNRSGDKKPKRIIYIDTDTTFTAYLLAGFVPMNDSKLESKYVPQEHYSNHTTSRQQSYSNDHDEYLKNVKNKSYQDCIVDNKVIQVFLPSEGRFESTLGDVIASIQGASIVIFDSLNSFYNLYPISYTESQQLSRTDKRSKETQRDDLITESFPAERRNDDKSDLKPLQDHKPKKTEYTIGRLNHLLSIYVMLLVKHGVTMNIPVLVTSMVRYKRVSDGLWIKAPTSRRLLHQKSLVKMSVEMSNENDLSVNLLKHPTSAQQTIVFPNTGIYSAFEINQVKS
jgi:hypothetical protein